MPAHSIFNVQDFLNGSGNDTAAIQEAVDRASECHGIVVVPPGHYRCSTIRMKPGVTLQGAAAFSFRDAQGTVLELVDPTATALIDLTSAFGAKLQSLCLRGLGSKAETVAHGILVEKPDYGKQEDTPAIDNCRIEQFSGDGIRLERIWCFSVRHSHCYKNGGCGLRVRGWDGFVCDNWFSGNGDAGYGAYDENASVTMTGNRIEWNRAGGIVLRHASHYNITGNYIDRSGKSGLDICDARVVTIASNVIYRSGKPDWGSDEDSDSAQIRIRNAAGVSCCANSLSAGRDDGGKGEFSPFYGIVLAGNLQCVITGNTMHHGAIRELLLDAGNNSECVIRDNPGSLLP